MMDAPSLLPPQILPQRSASSQWRYCFVAVADAEQKLLPVVVRNEFVGSENVPVNRRGFGFRPKNRPCRSSSLAFQNRSLCSTCAHRLRR